MVNTRTVTSVSLSLPSGSQSNLRKGLSLSSSSISDGVGKVSRHFS